MSTWPGKAGKTLFLEMSLRMFPEEISTWISRQSKEDHPPQCGWASSNPVGAWVEQKGRGGENSLSLLELRHPSPALRRGHSWFLGFQAQTRTYAISSPILRPADWITPPAFLVLQLADGRQWDFSACITAWANSCTKSPLLWIYIYPVGFVSLENPD